MSTWLHVHMTDKHKYMKLTSSIELTLEHSIQYYRIDPAAHKYV